MNKEARILDAAFKLFLRHGYRKVTMSDIAEAASLSRPSLYAAFANKEAVIQALAEQHAARVEADTLARFERLTELPDRLACAFDLWIIEPFASVIESEYGREMMASSAEFAPEATNGMYARFERIVAEELRPHTPAKSPLSADELARILMLAAKGLKASAHTLPELKRLCQGLIQMALATLSQKTST